MHVDTVVRLRRRLVLYMLGGVIANSVTVPIAVLCAQTFFATTHPLFLSLAYQLAMISILSAVLSLAPLRRSNCASSTSVVILASYLRLLLSLLLKAAELPPPNSAT